MSTRVSLLYELAVCVAVALLLAACAGSVPPGRLDFTHGRTPLGVSYRLPTGLAFDEAACVAQIDSDSVWDRRYDVVVVPGAWPDKDHGWVVGLCDTNKMVIMVAYRPHGESLPLPALLHEFNHARLSNETGNGDPHHLDPSWSVYY